MDFLINIFGILKALERNEVLKEYIYGVRASLKSVKHLVCWVYSVHRVRWVTSKTHIFLFLGLN